MGDSRDKISGYPLSPAPQTKTKLDPKDAALIAFIDTIGNTGGIVALEDWESADSYGAPYGCKFDRESTDLASAYLLACKATGIEPIIEGKPRRAYPIKRVDIVLTRSVKEESDDEDTACVHALASTFPEDIRGVRVLDCNGVELYWADQREDT
jgi:hypothetical protein